MNRIQRMSFLGLFSAVAILVVFCLCCTAWAANEKKAYECNYPSWETPGSWLNENFYFWFPRRVNELTKGQMVFHEFPAGTLMPGFDHFESTRDNIIQFAPSAGPYEIDTLPLATIFDLPGIFEGDEYESVFVKAREELLQAGLLDYFHKNGVHPFAICPLDGYSLWTTKKRGPVKTLDDTQGLKVRSPGGIMSQSLFVLGAVPVTIATGDIYTSLERGLLDGVSLTATSVSTLGILPVLSYWTPKAGTSRANIWILGNWAYFNKLPKHLQDALVQAGNELEAQWWGKINGYVTNDVRAEAAKYKVEIIDLSSEMAKAFKNKEMQLWDQWEQKYGNEANGLGKKLMTILKKYKD